MVSFFTLSNLIIVNIVNIIIIMIIIMINYHYKFIIILNYY